MVAISTPPSSSPKHQLTRTINQGITKGFTTSGFKTQVQPLSSFHESYGLEGDEDEDEDESMGDGEGETEGSEEE